MQIWKIALIGAFAGSINGLLGAGGGMILIPLLTLFVSMQEDSLFPASVCIMMPICAVSLCITALHTPIPFAQALPYLLGSIPGGILAGTVGKKVPTLWLHRGLGLMILWGGFRYLC